MTIQHQIYWKVVSVENPRTSWVFKSFWNVLGSVTLTYGDQGLITLEQIDSGTYDYNIFVAGQLVYRVMQIGDPIIDRVISLTTV